VTPGNPHDIQGWSSTGALGGFHGMKMFPLSINWCTTPANTNDIMLEDHQFKTCVDPIIVYEAYSEAVLAASCVQLSTPPGVFSCFGTKKK
jgi:hypothetical protein